VLAFFLVEIVREHAATGHVQIHWAWLAIGVSALVGYAVLKLLKKFTKVLRPSV
jgi:hypothetical protein